MVVVSVHDGQIQGSSEAFNFIYSDGGILTHLICCHTSHKSHNTALWVFATALEQTPHGYLGGPGFSSISQVSPKCKYG